MKIAFDSTGSIDNFRRIVDDVSNTADVEGMLILTCDENGYVPDTLDPVLQSAAMPLFGGVFPGIIYDQRLLKKGTLIIGVMIKIRDAISRALKPSKR